MRVAVNDVELYFDVEGASLERHGDGLGERPTILALHGAGLDHTYLRPPISPLADTAQIVYVDLRRHGRSGSVPIETCTLEQMADDIAAFCAMVGIKRPYLLGHSFGGFVALTLALRHRELPGALILADSAAYIDVPEALGIIEARSGGEARRIADAVLSRGDSSSETLADFGRAVVPAYTHPSTAAALADLAACKSDWEFPTHFFGRLRQHYDLRGHLHRIKTPTLAISGDYDWILPPSRGKEIAEGISGAELAVIPDAGHFAANERPAAFGASVRRFIDALDR
jgi:proline iminopeptidase